MICTHCALPTTEYDFLTAVDGTRVWIHGHCMPKASLRLNKTGRLVAHDFELGDALGTQNKSMLEL
jgi:hypothetical protein